jgi:hypothetical protein
MTAIRRISFSRGRRSRLSRLFRALRMGAFGEHRRQDTEGICWRSIRPVTV